MSKVSKTVMIAEDDTEVREAIERWLDVEGYNVLAFENGVAAMAYLKSDSTPPDLIITDYRMHGSGSEVAEIVEKKNIPIVMITGFQEEAISSLLDKNVQLPILTKPFTLERLMEIVEDYLGDNETHTSNS